MEIREQSFFAEMLRFALITLAIVLPIRFFIAEPFIVSGASMEPTFETGDYLVIDQFSYYLREPERGEVIVFHYPKNPEKYFIKRIIGLPLDTVVLSGTAVTIKNAAHPEGIILDQSYIEHPKDSNLSVTLKGGEYFVMGDNRAQSSDSRSWGTLPKGLIVGRAYLRLFPPSALSVLPGDHRNN